MSTEGSHSRTSCSGQTWEGLPWTGGARLWSLTLSSSSNVSEGQPESGHNTQSSSNTCKKKCQPFPALNSTCNSQFLRLNILLKKPMACCMHKSSIFKKDWNYFINTYNTQIHFLFFLIQVLDHSIFLPSPTFSLSSSTKRKNSSTQNCVLCYNNIIVNIIYYIRYFLSFKKW